MSGREKPRKQAQALAATLRAEMEWLAAVIDSRFRSYFRPAEAGPTEPPPPPPVPADSPYGRLLGLCGDGAAERILLALALAPHLAPQALDVFFIKHEKIERGFTEFGGAKGTFHAGFLPTGETALFLIAGGDLLARLQALRFLEPSHPLFLHGPIRLGAAAPDEPASSGILSFSPSFLRNLLTGGQLKAEADGAFPARPISTSLEWKDLVLAPPALLGLEEIVAWATHERTLIEGWRLGRRLMRGYRAIFHGPSGTGKTLAATLLGKRLGREVQRIDLSQVVSKYIGETEKNLALAFAEAERRDWILFFDEADALFGKRTATASSHDRFANQEVSYLLQRVEDHPGITILATNLRSNLDEAFARRFQLSIHFPAPDAGQRERLWCDSFGRHVPLDAGVDLGKTARDFELTGGQIINVVRHACLMAAHANSSVNQAAIDDGCRSELRAAGRTV